MNSSTATRAPYVDRFGYLLALSRPRFWLYLAGPVLVGLAYGASTVADLYAPLALALVAYFLVPANVLLYGVNDVFDADIDATNPKKNHREVRYGGQRFVLAAIGVCAAAGVALVLFVPAIARGWLVGFLVLAVAYSAPPFRFKTTPLLDSLSNGLYVLPGAVAYAAVAGHQPPLAALVGGWLWTMAMHTYSAIPDLEPDRQAGIRTTATVLGERRAYAYCVACWTLAAIGFWFVHPFLGVLLFVYPVFAVVVARSSVSVERAYWWFPALNGVVGGVFTMGGLWLLVGGG